MKRPGLFGTTLLVAFVSLFHASTAIDCFKCISINNDYQPCEDPFHNNYTIDIYHSPCLCGRKGRDGLFPATSCVKISGVFEDNKETIIVRGCALDSGTLTTDTELVRMSHCGGFYFANRYVKGCVQSCSDADGCNSSKWIHNGLPHVMTFPIFHLILKLFI